MRRMISTEQIEKLQSLQKVGNNDLSKINELFKFEALDSEHLQITFKASNPEEYMGIMTIYSLLGDDTNVYLILSGRIFVMVENVDNIAPVSSDVLDGFKITDTTGESAFGEAGVKTYEELYNSNLCMISLILF